MLKKMAALGTRTKRFTKALRPYTNHVGDQIGAAAAVGRRRQRRTPVFGREATRLKRKDPAAGVYRPSARMLTSFLGADCNARGGRCTMQINYGLRDEIGN